jgi:hypothetical protein
LTRRNIKAFRTKKVIGLQPVEQPLRRREGIEPSQVDRWYFPCHGRRKAGWCA